MRSVSKRLVVFAGLLAVPATTNVAHQTPQHQNPETNDPRLVRLQEFLAEKDCPISKYAADFIEAADANDLDWRLLPSISFIESGGGKEYMNNNVFGWDSCRQRVSVCPRRHPHRRVQTGHVRPVPEQNTRGKLRTYNPNAEYSSLVKSVMRAISRGEPAVLN